MSIKLAAIIALSILRIIQTQSVDESVPLTDEKTVPKIKENEQNDDFKIRSSLLDGLSDDELSKISNSTKSQVFHTEQDRLMKLIINSLYKNKEIFLRELISNGCDAIDKTRRESLTNSNIKDASDSSLFIRIKVDKDNNMIHVTDTGIGMTSDHLRDYLGTIAKSQTSEFLKTFAEGNESQDPNSMNDLIGQFGVGFYSSFLVADKIIVTSKHDDDDQYIWESDSKQFKIMKDPRGNTLNRGTTVSLHLKEEASEYLDLYKLRNIISKYSQFVRSPIYLWNHKEIEEDDIDEEVADDDVSEGKKDEDTKDKTSGGADDKDSGIDDDVKVSEEEVESSKHKKQKSAKKVKQTVWYWDHVNDVEPIWQRRPSEINNAEYVEFYKALVKRNETPLNYVHFSAEGDVNFRSIVYLPKASIPVYASSLNKANSDNIKLYVRRVFISEQADLLPSYLNFVRGIVDSDDLSLNISREELQQSKFLKTIRKKLIRKILDTLKSLNESEYIDFWKEFGTNMKFGVTEDSLNRLRLANLLRFYSSYSTMDGKRNFTSLNDYVQRARKNQKTIYYVSLPSLDNSKISPFVEKLIKKGYEVLYLVDPVDQFCLQNIPEFKNMKFQNAAKEGLDLKTSEKAKKQLEEIENEYQPLTRWMEEAFSDRIIKVILSQRLVETPMVFVASQWGYDGNMERISKAQAYQKVGGDSATVHFANMKRKLEINPKHPLIKDLLRRVKDDKSDPEFREIAEVCVDTAMIRSGYELRDPLKFTDRIEAILRQVMKIPVKQSMDFADEEDDDELADISETTSSKKDDSEDLADESITNKNKHTLNQRQKRSAAVQAVSNSKGKRKQKLNKKATTSTEKNKKNAKVDKMDRSKTSRDSASNKIKKQHRPSKFNFVENKCKRKHHSGRSNYRKHRDEHNTNNGYDKQPHCILKAVPEMNSTSSNYNTSSKQIRKQKKSKQLHPKSNWSATKTEDKKRKINKLVDSPAGVQSSQSDKPTIKVTTTLPGGKAVKHAPRSSKLFAYSNDKQNTKTPNNFNRRLWIRWQNNKIFKLASKCWRYLVSDSSSDDSQTDYMHLSGFAMAIDVKSAGNSFSKHAVKKDPRREEMISTPSGVYMKNGKLCVGFRYRYRLSNFLKSTEGKLWVLRSNYAVPESILNEINGNDEMIYDRNARVVVSKPSVGYEHRYRISNYLKTLNVDEISNLYDQGYLRPIIMPGNAPGIVNQQTIKSSTLVFTNIWRAIANLFTYQHCVEYETYNGSDISIDTSKTEKKKNSLTGTIGYAFRYRLSRKLDAEKKLAGLEESSDRVKLKPPNVLYPYRYRVSNMLRSFNITYEDMAKMMKNNTWDGFRRKKETIKQKHDRQISVLSETDQLIGLSEEERLLKEAKLVGNPELSKIHIDIKDLYPAELISVGYTYRYRRSRKMIALNISKYEIEKRRWFLLEQKFKDNTLKLLSKTEHLKHSNESTKEEKYAAELMNTAKTVGVIFTLDYSQLTPEEKRVGYEYRYRISRKYQTQMPLYILKNLNNSTNLSMKVFQKLKAKDELKIDEGEDYFKQNLNYHSPHHLDYMQLSDKVNDILNSNKANTYSIIRKYMQRNDGISLTKQETENKEIGEKCRVKRAKGNSKRHGSATNNKSRKKLEPYVADSVKVTCDVDDIKKENHIDSFEDYSNKITVKEPKQLKDKSSHPKKRKSTLRDIKQSDQVSNRPQLDTKYKDSSYTQQNQENKPLRPIASTNDQLGKIDNMEQTFRSDDVSDHVDVTESTKDNTVKDKIHKLTNQNDKSLSTDHDVKQDATANHNPDNHEYVIDTKTVSFVELTHIWWKRLLTEIFNLII